MAALFPSPTSKQLHEFLENYFSREIDEAQLKKFMNYFKNGSEKEKEILETCISLLTPFSIRSMYSLSQTYDETKLLEHHIQETERKMSEKEMLLEKEIKKLNNRIQILTEVCDELRENYINLYRRTNEISSKKISF